ncbi:hypothetical protein JW805_03060 [Roseomonas aeriglobus]|nr:hypothetical protein [Roseomonas aeriglobus]
MLVRVRPGAPLPSRRGHRWCDLLGVTANRQLEGLDRSRDGYAVGRDHDLGDKPAGVALPQRVILGSQLAEDDFAEPLDGFRRHPTVGCGQLTLDQQDLLLEIGAARPLCGEACGEVCVAWRHDSLFDEIEHVLYRTLDPRPLGAKRLEVRLSFANGGGTVVE